MFPACMTLIFGAVVGSASGAGVLAWLRWLMRRRSPAKLPHEPPSATFQEWVAAILAEEEACITTRQSEGLTSR